MATIAAIPVPRARLGAHAAQTAVSYSLATLALALYGIKVCPFLESLSWPTVAAVLAGGFALAAPLRLILLRRILSALRGRRLGLAALAYPRRVLAADLSLWVAVGVALMAFDTVFFGFPLESGLKVIVGCAALGMFGAVDLSLQVERELMERMAEQGVLAPLDRGRIFPLSRKFVIIVAAMLVFVALVLTLILKKDLHYLEQAGEGDAGARFVSVAKEIVFVMAVMLAGCLLVARRFASNMNALFGFQIRAMDAVARGDYGVAVPVVSRDELNVIASHTNRMIAGLKEKERIKSAFGKYMSPAVARRILETEGGAELGGRSADVAVLFTDIRGFTPLSERLDPRGLVAVLNEYFTMIVECVHDHGGVLDKFIGDAAMGVFGLEGAPGACDHAASAAFAMRERLAGFNASLASRGLPRIDHGIGIHFGQVLAGNIGSPERLEYTVIGDHVNIAARLESVTKDLGAHVVVSEAVHSRLAAPLKARFRPLGPQPLKGKSAPVTVFGAD